MNMKESLEGNVKKNKEEKMEKEQTLSVQTTPDEKGGMLEKRVRSDAKLVKEGAKFKVDKNNNISVVLTKKQEALIRDEMKLDKKGESLDELMFELSRLSLGDEEKSKQFAEKINLKDLSPDTKLALYEVSDNNYYIADAIIDSLEFDQQLKLIDNVSGRHSKLPLARKLFNLIEEGKKENSTSDIIKVVGILSQYSMSPSDARSLAGRIPWDDLSNTDKIVALDSIQQEEQWVIGKEKINWDNLSPQELIKGFKSSRDSNVDSNLWVLSEIVSENTKILDKFTVKQLEELKECATPNDNLLREIKDLLNEKRNKEVSNT